MMIFLLAFFLIPHPASCILHPHPASCISNLASGLCPEKAGEEVIIVRRNVPVARIVPLQRKNIRRIGGLRGRPFRSTAKFDNPAGNAAIADAFKPSGE
jgi:antitoxin (DNA-binding transcriptional repressor) of toxin-antitoxin stability system